MRVHILLISWVGLLVYALGCAPQNTNSLSTLPKFCTNSGDAYISLPSTDKPSDVCKCDSGYYAGIVPNSMVGGHQLVGCLLCPATGACPPTP